ncbi:hypothetical protein [Mucilaginibacter sp.]|uniref:hypothetical protein n=1 Tax=Mucilaginibacter sp. TaxID=1882438 RepID=UPI00283CEF4B|nr:hypothetical protein [Mucilaginibacter sp.]MDR3694024.1 hypothetical protein [Mucilaginibacter sp.]
MNAKINPGLLFFLFLFLTAICPSCSKHSDTSTNNGNNGSTINYIHYKGALVGSTGYLDLHLTGSALNGNNASYMLVNYVDSSKTPVNTIKDSLTTGSLSGWQPGTAISNAVFAGSSGIKVSLISVDADGSNPITKMQVPNDPFVKTFIEKETVSNTPLLVFIGKAVPVGSGIASPSGTCTCYAKTINFVINPAYVGSSYAAANAIYIDSYSHLAGFLNAQILSANPNQLTQIINNNDTAGLHVNNGAGGPNSNNGSGPVTGTIQISNDGNSLSGSISGMYIPNTGSQASSCSCSYTIKAIKVK